MSSKSTDHSTDPIPEWQPIGNIYCSALLWRANYEWEDNNSELDVAEYLQHLAETYFYPINREINNLEETNVLAASKSIRKYLHETFQLYAQHLIETNHLYDGTINWIDKANQLKLESLSLLE